MSKKEQLAASLEQLSDLCFTISGLVLEDGSGEKTAGSSKSSLSPAAAVFEPKGEGAVATGKQESSPVLSEDWEAIPDLASVDTSTPPTFSQVVGGSQSVLVTPVRRVERAESVDSVGSRDSMANLPPNYATCTADEFNAYWDGLPSDNSKQAAENTAMQIGSANIKIAALLKRDQRNTARMAAVNAQLAQAQAQAQQAQAAAQAAAAAGAGGAGGAVTPARDVKMAQPPKFENKEGDMAIRHWIPLIEEYFINTPDNDYLRMASSYVGGKPRTYWVGQYAAYRSAHGGAEPPNPRQFFRDTLTSGYGARDPLQSYFDTWNNIRQKPGQSVDDYNIAFQQALTDLGGRITDEDAKLEKYRSGLQADIREMCRSNPATGDRWLTLEALMRYATLQWPVVEERLAKRKANQPAKVVGGKRKASGVSPGKSSKAKLGVALTAEQREHNMKHRLCHKCGKPNHIAKDCTEEVTQDKPAGKGKKAKKTTEDF